MIFVPIKLFFASIILKFHQLAWILCLLFNKNTCIACMFKKIEEEKEVNPIMVFKRQQAFDSMKSDSQSIVDAAEELTLSKIYGLITVR